MRYGLDQHQAVESSAIIIWSPWSPRTVDVRRRKEVDIRAVSRSDLVVLTRIGTRQGVARRDFRDLVARHRRTFHVGIVTLPRRTYVCVLLRGTLYVHYLRPHVHFTCMYVNSLPARSSRSHPGGMRPRSRPVSSRSRNQFSDWDTALEFFVAR